MLTLTRPGGVVAIQEPDATSCNATPPPSRMGTLEKRPFLRHSHVGVGISTLASGLLVWYAGLVLRTYKCVRQ